MNAIGTELKDVYIITNKVFEDERGYFFESFNLDKFSRISGFDKFVQDNHSKSCQGVLRGLHYQVEHPQGKLVRCISGEILDVVVDLREYSPTFGKYISIILNKNNIHLWIPPGFAHGFYTLSKTAEVCYKTTDYYYPEFSRTLMWNDPQLNINWGNIEPILSKQDISGKSFHECEKYRM